MSEQKDQRRPASMLWGLGLYGQAHQCRQALKTFATFTGVFLVVAIMSTVGYFSRQDLFTWIVSSTVGGAP